MHGFGQIMNWKKYGDDVMQFIFFALILSALIFRATIFCCYKAEFIISCDLDIDPRSFEIMCNAEQELTFYLRN